ncbi:hypothetical protein CC85DRAFT_329003 [Cutaneotrichosporon oleaginosum]|uniref:BZIP domain-containing protein n=1 Tax=Cutaneotrichosporon oleaginosum TaxID=879819 RepID=A0A0J0XKA0_9TREE|nr:uncharacterized protein CC85DRAFT_329003 [Cutaneotrichosporon oleaginosum]KLT41515.1 hypothetical protein CC85DRAFT_329003 [Cutaneotrichosporon oleaginosum]TXT05836.1 hypothetical protein COLE_07156 [Cutaneotrichosporon oleaginosum]
MSSSDTSYPPCTPPGEAGDLTPLDQHPNAIRDPPSPSDFLLHPKRARFGAGGNLSLLEKCKSPPLHTVGTPVRPIPRQRNPPYDYKSKRPTTASSSTRSTIQQRHHVVLAPMRRLDVSDGEDQSDDDDDTKIGVEKDEDDVGKKTQDLAAAEPGNDDHNDDDTPLREATPSEATVELDDDYVPINSVRTRGSNRHKTTRKVNKEPAQKTTKAKATEATKAAATKTKSATTKKAKLSKGAAGERRMSQNRCAQKKYRDKNKRLADLRINFNLAAIRVSREYEAGDITSEDAMEQLITASDHFRADMAATCPATGQQLEEDILKMDKA